MESTNNLIMDWDKTNVGINEADELQEEIEEIKRAQGIIDEKGGAQ